MQNCTSVHYRSFYWPLQATIWKAWRLLFEKVGFRSSSSAVARYMCQDEGQARFLVLIMLSEIFLCLKQKTCVMCVSITTSIVCLYLSLRTGNHSWWSLVLPDLPSVRLSSFPLPQVWSARRGGRIRQAGRVHGARWHTHAYLYSFSRSDAKIIGIVGPRPAASRVVAFDERSLKVPALQSLELVVNPAFPDWSGVYIKLFWLVIRMHATKKNQLAFHSRSKHKKKRVHLSERKSVHPMALTHQ